MKSRSKKVVIIGASSKLEAQRKLHFPSQSRTRNATEIPRTDLQRRRIEWRSICEVVGLPSKLNALAFRNREVLEHRKVHAAEPRGSQNISSASAIMPPRGHKRTRIEPALQCPLVTRESTVRDPVRPMVATRTSIV